MCMRELVRIQILINTDEQTVGEGLNLWLTRTSVTAELGSFRIGGFGPDLALP